MSLTPIAVVAVSRAGVAAPAGTAADTVNGNSVANTNQNVILSVHNTDSGAAHNFTINFAATVDGQAVAARVVSIPEASSMLFGPFPRSDYGSVLSVLGAHADLLISPLLISL